MKPGRRAHDGDLFSFSRSCRSPMEGEPLVTVKRHVLSDQVLAAVEIRNALDGWSAANGVLSSLARMKWEDEHEAALAKAAVLNQLYFTNVMAIFRMAKRIESLAKDGVFDRDDPVEVVEAIAALDGENSKRKHWVFASKYAHFFIDTDRFPIYDRLAADMVLFHTGERMNISERENPYRLFYDRFIEVRGASGLSSRTCSDMDAYLWLAGCYRLWLKKGEKAEINREVFGYLADTKRDGTSKKEVLLRRLIPEDYFGDFA